MNHARGFARSGGVPAGIVRSWIGGLCLSASLAGCSGPERGSAPEPGMKPGEASEIHSFDRVPNGGLLATDGLLYRIVLWKDGHPEGRITIEGKWSDLNSVGVAGHPEARVAVTIRNRFAEETSWEIRVAPEPGYGVAAVEFPLLVLQKPEDATTERLIVPNQMGQLIENPSDQPEREIGLRPRIKKSLWFGTYGALQSMQMMLYECDDRGVMIWTQDPEGYIKDYEVSRDLSGGVKGLRGSVHHYPENTGRPGTAWTSPYPVITTGYRGGWPNAAERYRKWAVQQPWCAKGTILERIRRGELPAWYAKNPLWISAVDAGGLSYLLRYADLFAADGVQIGVFLTQWQRWPFDSKNPEYFPPKDPAGLARLIEAQARGLRLFPYMNAQLVHADYPPMRDRWMRNAAVAPADPQAMAPRNGRAFPDYFELWGTDVETTDVWRARLQAAWSGPVDEELLREIASEAFPDLDYRRTAFAGRLRKEWGQTEVWKDVRARNRFAPMCRSSADWVEGFAEMARTSLLDYGTDGQYLDQLCASVYPCWSEDHGHPPGFGRYFLQGSRRMAERIREICPGRVLFMERLCEFYIGAVEESYAIDPDYRRRDVIPLFSAVYHGFAAAHEWNVPVAALDRMEDFTSAVSQSMHFGHKVGSFVSVEPWVELLKPGRTAQLEWLRQLVRLRMKTLEEWTYGRRLRDPEIQPARFHEVRVFDGARATARTRPVIEGSCWASSADPSRVLLVLSNCSAEPQTASVSCDALNEGDWVTDADGRTYRYDPLAPIRIEPFSWIILRRGDGRESEERGLPAS
ncbi:MAG: DUF6259 domain-containing protein [Kiritimatiellia bacterium]|nr:DUF6259 domain-containing protein [Kiritimatiellia bacterium]